MEETSTNSTQQYAFLVGSTYGIIECEYRSAASVTLPTANWSSEEGSRIKWRLHSGLPRTTGRSCGGRMQKEVAQATALHASGWQPHRTCARAGGRTAGGGSGYRHRQREEVRFFH
ncbi:hypothetical protein GW17_00045412 [Ensete ventricosum]|nr:hypothetical protein GW17_00045412 [Ensete ventricosum]